MKTSSHSDSTLHINCSRPENTTGRAPQRPIYSRSERYSFPDPSDPPAVAPHPQPAPGAAPFVGPPAP